MKTEKTVLYFVATLVGLLVAGGLFYLYQPTKTIPASKAQKPIVISKVSPTTPSSSVYLTLDQPKDEDVVNKKIITISGTTTSNAVIIILTADSQQVITPTLTGFFSTTVTLDDGENTLEITAIAPNGEEKKEIRTITFSNEDF